MSGAKNTNSTTATGKPTSKANRRLRNNVIGFNNLTVPSGAPTPSAASTNNNRGGIHTLTSILPPTTAPRTELPSPAPADIAELRKQLDALKVNPSKEEALDSLKKIQSQVETSLALKKQKFTSFKEQLKRELKTLSDIFKKEFIPAIEQTLGAAIVEKYHLHAINVEDVSQINGFFDTINNLNAESISFAENISRNGSDAYKILDFLLRLKDYDSAHQRILDSQKRIYDITDSISQSLQTGNNSDSNSFLQPRATTNASVQPAVVPLDENKAADKKNTMQTARNNRFPTSLLEEIFDGDSIFTTQAPTAPDVLTPTSTNVSPPSLPLNPADEKSIQQQEKEKFLELFKCIHSELIIKIKECKGDQALESFKKNLSGNGAIENMIQFFFDINALLMQIDSSPNKDTSAFKEARAATEKTIRLLNEFMAISNKAINIEKTAQVQLLNSSSNAATGSSHRSIHPSSTPPTPISETKEVDSGLIQKEEKKLADLLSKLKTKATSILNKDTVDSCQLYFSPGNIASQLEQLKKNIAKVEKAKKEISRAKLRDISGLAIKNFDDAANNARLQIKKLTTLYSQASQKTEPPPLAQATSQTQDSVREQILKKENDLAFLGQLIQTLSTQAPPVSAPTYYQQLLAKQKPGEEKLIDADVEIATQMMLHISAGDDFIKEGLLSQALSELESALTIANLNKRPIDNLPARIESLKTTLASLSEEKNDDDAAELAKAIAMSTEGSDSSSYNSPLGNVRSALSPAQSTVKLPKSDAGPTPPSNNSTTPSLNHQ